MSNSSSNNNHNESRTNDSNNNVWATLPNPIVDIWLFDIVPNYLCPIDLQNLSLVNHRYNELFGYQTNTAKHILIQMIQRDNNDGQQGQFQTLSLVKVIDQLPAIGKLSSEESLQYDPWFISQLIEPAKKRRGLIKLQILPLQSQQQQQQQLQQQVSDTNVTYEENLQLELQQIYEQYKPITSQQILKVIQERLPYIQSSRLISTSFRKGTKFLCMNQSGHNIYCHFIDSNGNLTIRDGDCIPPMQTAITATTPENLTIDVTTTTLPPYIFCHQTHVSHSFALCYQEGGPPFAIYQIRQQWKLCTERTPNIRFCESVHIHAISIFPGGIVKELNCNFCQIGRHQFQYQFQPQQDDDEIGITDENAAYNTVAAPSQETKDMAKVFYCHDILSLESDYWRQDFLLQPFWIVAERSEDFCVLSRRNPTVFGPAFYSILNKQQQPPTTRTTTH